MRKGSAFIRSAKWFSRSFAARSAATDAKCVRYRGTKFAPLARRKGCPGMQLPSSPAFPTRVRCAILEYGRDTKLSSVEAVAQALGLKLELVGT